MEQQPQADVSTRSDSPALDAPGAPPAELQPYDVAPNWRRWMQTENLGLGLTLGYLFLSGLGMLHRALVFMRFRLNIMDYAEPSDFLLAALRDPLIIFACVAPIPVVAVYFRLSQALAKRTKRPRWAQGKDSELWRRRMDSVRRPMYLFTMFLWALAASLHYARRVAEDIRAGKGRRVHVELASDVGSTSIDTTSLLLIGTTQKYLFFYNSDKQLTSVVPAENVARLVVDARRKPK